MASGLAEVAGVLSLVVVVVVLSVVLAALFAPWQAPRARAAAPVNPRTISFRSRLIVVPSRSFGPLGLVDPIHVRVIKRARGGAVPPPLHRSARSQAHPKQRYDR
jgi:hypothetical protein